MLPTDLPELVIVRVLTPGGPYALGDVLSVAYTSPTVGKLVAHDTPGALRSVSLPTLVPETISVRVTHAAPPYAAGDILTLSFLDPRVARIHPSAEDRSTIEHRVSPMTEAPGLVRETEGTEHKAVDWLTTSDRVSHAPPSRAAIDDEPHVTNAADVASTRVGYEPDASDAVTAQPSSSAVAERDGRTDIASGSARTRDDRYAIADASRATFGTTARTRDSEFSRSAPRSYDRATDAGGDDEDNATQSNRGGVRVRLNWSADRVRRFVQVVDKLFTVDRLGWYRHAFAMRLLVPDDISCGDPLADVEATRHLVALRAAAVETLGRPLLAAFMPNFTVTSDWLDLLDNPAAARAVAGLREAIGPHVSDASPRSICDDASFTVGFVERRAFETQPASTVESILPIFIASDSTNVALTDRLRAYRRTLVDVFGQTATSADAVRLNGMAQPNHSLDDRLWQLVGTVGESLGGLAVA